MCFEVNEWIVIVAIIISRALTLTDIQSSECSLPWGPVHRMLNLNKVWSSDTDHSNIYFTWYWPFLGTVYLTQIFTRVQFTCSIPLQNTVYLTLSLVGEQFTCNRSHQGTVYLPFESYSPDKDQSNILFTWHQISLEYSAPDTDSHWNTDNRPCIWMGYGSSTKSHLLQFLWH